MLDMLVSHAEPTKCSVCRSENRQAPVSLPQDLGMNSTSLQGVVWPTEGPQGKTGAEGMK
ncbi:hypothetical protein Pcinc_029896, partial [Petrolisthes cinctipes]